MPRYQRITAVLAALFIATPLAAQGSSRVAMTVDTVNIVAPVSGELLAAQAAVVTPAVAPATAPVVSLAPTRENAVAGLQLRTEGFAPMPVPAPGRNSGNTALMIVGGAALIVGSIIDGDAGTIIMIGGGVIGLYGLWQYLK